MSSSQNTNANESHSLPLLDCPRASVTDFGGLTPRYHAPMYYPTEVSLYEPSVAAAAAGSSGGPSTKRLSAIRAEVNVPLPCGYFNFWRPLHDCTTPISSKLERYFPESTLISSTTTTTTSSQWDSRISYSSADDEYYENGRALPFIKSWNRGVLSMRNIFRKIEPDWGMAYLAPNNQGPNTQSLAVWRFNYVESRRAIRSFHAVLGFSVFSPTASVQWYIRPLSRLQFKRIPTHILTADEAQSFPEITGRKASPNGDGDMDAALKTRARIIAKHRGEILMYVDQPDEFNPYISHTVPALVIDLSEYVEGEYGFEIAAAFFPATEGDNRWQKVQIARQALNRPVGGRMLEGEDALVRCGLDFRIKLQDDVIVKEASMELRDALAEVRISSGLPPMIDDSACDFVIRVSDPDNIVGSLQPPIRAHERVLAVGSEYFAALLASSMTESAAKQVDLDNMPYGAVRLAVNYLYTGRVPCESDMSLDDWITLLDVSSRLSIPRLHQLCQARIFQEALIAGQSNADEEEVLDTGATARYQDMASYPDMSTISYLQDVANDTGARELSCALNRLVAYYPIQVCEERVRSAPAEIFAPRSATSSIRIRRVAPHQELVDPNPALLGHHPHAHDEQQPFEIVEHMHLEHEFADQEFNDMAGEHFALPAGEPRPQLLGLGGPALMPGLVLHPGLLAAVPRHRPADINHEQAPEPAPAQQGGLFGRLLGNWRVVNNNNNNNQPAADAPPPPDPQPGPVPEVPHPRPTSAARLNAPETPQTLTQPPPDPQPGPAPPAPEAGRGL
ncbi:protein modification by small protein conjugation or removal [Coemansia aciculifera]|nr:protein modification by small protein conjugation or removal [Coemansia aciculifera]